MSNTTPLQLARPFATPRTDFEVVWETTGWLHSERFGTNASINCKTTWKVCRQRNADALRNWEKHGS
jgi:hypothetical protein